MRPGSWVVSAGILMLAGCGGGGGVDPTPQVSIGTLDAGNPAGVSYSTATQSGVIGIDGTFRFISGESISFRVAGVELGRVPGAARISVFTLAGMSPPTTELQLRRELAQVANKGTNFSRAMNVSMLLLSLDADNDPTNGMDLRNRDEALADASLNLDAPAGEFSSALKAAAPELNSNLPLKTSVSMLYRWINVTVPGHQPVGANNVDGQQPAVRFRGSYDAHGRLATNEVDYTGDGHFDDTFRYAYDHIGRGTFTVSERDVDANRVVDFVRKVSSRFDPRGNLLGTEDISDTDADGIDDSRSTSESSFDSRGRPLMRTYAYDVDADGIVDASQVTTFFYHTAGEIEREVTEVDVDLDGTADGRFTIAYTYLSGNVASRTYERDMQVDGVEFRRRILFGYDSQGRLTFQEDAIDDTADGIVDISQRERQEYDSRGNVNRRVTEFEYGSSGVIEDRVDSRFEYDHGRRLLSDFEEYSAADQVVDLVVTRTYAYDANGFPTRVDQQFDDHSLPGKSRDVTTFEHSADGAELRTLRESDEDGDGDVDQVMSREIEYEPVANAVLQIASQYLPGT